MDTILTIIIPVYNTEKYIIRCLNSVNHPLINVIIIDDGSFDNSPQIIDEYCSTHRNFQVIHTENRGAAAARATGVKEIKTKYFSFVDSDDIVNILPYLNLVKKMDENGFKVGNGRMTVFLPNSRIPLNSKKWTKERLDFSKDKLEFSNTTCSLLDKIWHIDCAPLFLCETKQKVYEDMEVVYYAMAKNQKMIHTNTLIYNYCMRGLENNSTSAIGLQVTKSDALKGLLSAAESMNQKFIIEGLYSEYKSELDAIIIKLVYQRIYHILVSKKIVNKKEMSELAFQILRSFISTWDDNKYFLSHFKYSEYNDYLFYIGTEIMKRLYGVKINFQVDSSYQELLEEYDKRIILKRNLQ